MCVASQTSKIAVILMDNDILQDVLTAEPFKPFRIVTDAAKIYVVQNPQFIVRLKTQIFYAYPNSDHFALIALRNISAIETVDQAA